MANQNEPLKLTARQLQLLEFVKMMHGNQTRKYTNEPYWHHVVSVANIVSGYSNDAILIEVALCHDLFEDTECTSDNLRDQLYKSGYSTEEAEDVVGYVEDLTDWFTKEKYPGLNRAARKKKEALRLGGIPIIAQNVKYADLIDNTSSIVAYDPEFAKTYLQEKIEILNRMRDGEINLFIRCCHTLYVSLNPAPSDKEE